VTNLLRLERRRRVRRRSDRLPLTRRGRYNHTATSRRNNKEDYLAPLGRSVNRLAKALGIGAARMNEIVRGERGITADTALRLARYFGTTAEFWLTLQSLYDLRVAERKARAKIEREITPLKVA
jgi:addiction module HigA family antidote